MIKKSYYLLLCFLFSLVLYNTALAADFKPRLVVLTDISPNNVEPDDMESMIRLLVHADMYEIEALISSTGWSVSSSAGDTGLNLIREAIDLYEKDLPNLMKRSNQQGYLHDGEHQKIGYWPSADYLRSRTMSGSKNRGQQYIGANNNSDGSKKIIELADEDDDRPVWVTVWGGGNTLAQACWQVQQERNAEDLKAFLHKLRVYTITDQDGAQKSGNVINWAESSHQWMRKEFEKDLFFIWDECAWGYQNGTGRSRWDDYQTNIQGHGNLGNRYPKYKYGVEGDTPSFLYLMPTGLNNPEVPSQVSWGGYFEFGKCKDNATNAYQNHSGNARNISSKYQHYFYQATFNNFAARMDWAKDGAGNRNPVIVLDGDDGISVLTKTPRQGTAVTLDASQTFDPDGDNLKFNWWVLSEAGTYSGKINISNSNSSIVTVNVPSDSAGKSFHVICEVIDDGTHNLSDYRRIIFEPTGPAPKKTTVNLRSGEPNKIMPVGDSITAGEHYGYPPISERTGYRKDLYEMLTKAGYHVDFVGSQNHGERPKDDEDWYDWNNEAYPGWKIDGIASKVKTALEVYNPDILLVHVGTNGSHWDQKPDQVMDMLDMINTYSVENNHPVTVFLCKIINRFKGGHAPTTGFNNAVADLVAGRTGDKIKIIMVDMESGAGLDYSDTSPDPTANPPYEGGDMWGETYPHVSCDLYHPNDKGNAKMAVKFYEALVKELGKPTKVGE